ncbi:MAG: hypothetical protein U1F48_07105 [Burkholderiales bacterium]
MTDHFAAFSFVDRITDYRPGTHARGRFAIPAGVDAFPPALVAEAVGQLAAWVAMEHIAYRGRPVAALANETRFLAPVAPGDVLELAVDIETADDEAVAYKGTADVAGRRVIELNDCLGPMLPVGDFDDPAALAARFKVLTGEGAAPGRFRGIVPPQAVRTGGVRGESATATLAVPSAAPFFNDHFPRRAVFPATLLLNAQIGLALGLAAEAPHWPAATPPVPLRMTHVKVRSFTPPGATLALGAELKPPVAGVATCMLTADADGKRVATARVDLAPRSPA